MDSGRLPEERLEAIERSAREGHTLKDKVTLELIDEIRRLRGLISAKGNNF